MGGRQSTPEPAHLSKPWRDINWGNKQADLQYVKDFMPPPECEKIRILLHGLAGAGKSSFINSVQSVLRGRMCTLALTENTSGGSFNQTYSTYKIQKSQGSFYPFVFSDTMGLEDRRGVLVDDVKMALKGHVKEGYRFNAYSRLPEGDQHYNSSPGLRDKVHVLVCVIPVNTASLMREETVRKIREIRKEASELRIPQVILLTKIDRFCPEVAEDLKNVYKVKYIQQEMEEFSAKVGVPMNCIFPVKNYNDEINIDDDVDSLILSALTNIITFGENFIRSSGYGGGFTHPAAPPPYKFLQEPWRNINWGNKQDDLQYVKDFVPPPECEKIRILLHGPVGAGKSSFINSVRSVLRGRMCTMALAENTSVDSFTKKYKTYDIEKECQGSFYPFVFSDIMGLENTKGVLVDDIKMALKGHVKEGYRFNADSRLTEGDQHYNSSPDLSDKVHVLVCVVPADTASSIKEGTVQKICEIRREASDLGIPQVVLLTKIDKFCPEVQEDLKDVYKIKTIKQEMEKFSAEVGVPMNCIFPVKNYSDEIKLNDGVDSLILSALTNIITFGEDFIRSSGYGGGFTHPAVPPPYKYLSQPWRKINWGNKQADLQHVKDFMPPPECEKIRILLHGPVGAGKSSFINSVQSVLRGRTYTMSLAENTSGDSFTKKYETYKIPKDQGSFYPFVFSDIMGLQNTKGVLVEDIKMALKGHVKEGYRFNADSRLTEGDQHYNSSPDLSDKVHVLVCVVPATTASSIKQETVQKICEIREEASDLGIPQVVLLTKIDKFCPEVKEDLKDVYKIRSIKQKMEKLSAEMGVPMNCIFPVKNYSEEIDIDDDVDLLILSALKKIINFGEDFINRKMNQS